MYLITADLSTIIENLKTQFDICFIQKDRWKLMLTGLENTLIMTMCACVIGVVIGVVVASVRSSYDKNEENLKFKGGFGYLLLKFFNGLCKVYLTIFRGTPVVVQLLIWYFILLKSCSNGVLVGIIAFGVNSGAYVAEIFRGGIMAVDNGQFEAGRSIGFNYFQTMRYIVIPQMFKAALPTMLNEFIALLKETSVAGYVAVTDLTKAGNSISGTTYIYYMPLLTVATVYLIMVMLLTKIVGNIERRLRKNER
ncbi:MAG: amino acid ABC transporter permease [Eubacterium sp.]